MIALHPSFLTLSPLLAYAYSTSLMYSWKNEEWTLLACVSLACAGHALSFLATRRSTAARAFIIRGGMGSIRNAGCIRVAIVERRGKGEIVLLLKKDFGDAL